jgi:NTE family protein
MKLLSQKTGVVLALGGGGARGFAHIGVLKVLEREGVKIGAIAGTSMGAIVGAMYALYADAIEVEEVFRKFLSSPFHERFGKTFFLLSEDPTVFHEPGKTALKLGKRFMYMKAASTGALFSRDVLDEAFKYLLPDIRFSDLRIPFACVAADLRTGEEVVLGEGKLIPAVIASSSIPGFVEPARLARRLLVDGSIISTVPVDAARRLSKGKLVAVDVSLDIDKSGLLGTAFDVAIRSGDITSHYLTKSQLMGADLVVHPRVGRTTWANFDKLDEMIHAGESAARKILQSL